MMTAQTSEELADLLHGSATPNRVIDAPLTVWLEALRDAPDLAFVIAGCAEAPMPVLACIAVGGDQRAKSRLVMRNALPSEIDELLESDPEVGAPVHAVHAPDIAWEKLERFLNHRWPSVRGVAQARLAELEEPGSDG